MSPSHPPRADRSAGPVLEAREEIVSAESAVVGPAPGIRRREARATAAHPSADVAAGADGAQALLVPAHRAGRRGRGADAASAGSAAPVASPPAAARPRRGEEPAGAEPVPPAIKVRVGRVEIRALEPAARPRRRGGEGPRGGWTPPVLSLDGYLRTPGGER